MDTSTSPAMAEPVGDLPIVTSGNLVFANLSAALQQVQPSTSANVSASASSDAELIFLPPVARTEEGQTLWSEDPGGPFEGFSKAQMEVTEEAE